ncbi:MAG: TonB-dependent siderophore receptor [Hylemonella sp.]|uniref:TonB-dependent siderophore receptor n=1 Tax=Hylemonella sp. TaxID=2066020 RepID=UPI0022C5B093|nr:TonB-dependent siderophore receptor [Hylemonella sp.]MCZ8250894.1 TonB-dependent siderophore receptor [Hylemonella sp.]
MRKLTLKLRPLALAAASLCLSVQAQTVPAGGTLSEVTVAADAVGSFTSSNVQVGAFRDQDPLDVPLTNNVLTREVLDAQGANTLHGALRNTAGVNHAQISNSTYDNIAIRGLLVENRSNYRLNGSLPIINLIDTPLENKERVEVLKGGSSLYYGMVPPSGVVNFVTKRAGSTPVTSLATSVNNHGGVDAHVDIGRRFGEDDSMGLRLNAVAGKQETGIRNYDGDRQLVSAAYDWKVNRRFTLKADVEHYRKDVSEQAAITLPSAVGGVITLPGVPDNKTNLAGSWQRYNAEATNALLRGDIMLSDDWALVLETGRAETIRDRRYSQFQNYNLATGAGDLRISFANGQRYVNTNQRAEVTGQVVTGSVQHELTVGYTQNERWSYSGDSASNVTVSQNLYNPVQIAELNPVIATPGSVSVVNDKGIYAYDRLKFNEQWQLMAGVRATDYVSQTSTRRYTDNKVSPNVSLLFKPQVDTTVYVSYLEGLEETGTAPANRANAGEILTPSINKQYELGLKTRAWSKLLAQASVFQIERPQTTFDAANNFIIGGDSRYRGVELSAAGEVSPRLAVVASALFLDAEIVSVTAGGGNAGELGKRPENTPRQTLSLFGEYRLKDLAGLALNAGAYHVGERAANNLNQAWVPSYTTYSVGTRYRTKWDGRNVTLQANIDNLLDKDYWATAGNGLLGTGAPRTLRLAAKFDL